MTAGIGIAVLGTGRIGHLHALNAAQAVPGARLVGVADVDRWRRARAVEAARQRAHGGRLHELLADPPCRRW